jgi:hypothetical protein
MNIAWSHDLDEVFGAHNPCQQPLPRPCWRSGRSAPRSSTRAVQGKRFSEPSRSGPAPAVPAQDQCRTGIGVPDSPRPGTGVSAHRVQLGATLRRGRSDLRPAAAVPVQHQRVSHQVGAGVSPDSPGVRRRQRSYPRAGCCRSRDGGCSRLPPGSLEAHHQVMPRMA